MLRVWGLGLNLGASSVSLIYNVPAVEVTYISNDLIVVHMQKVDAAGEAMG